MRKSRFSLQSDLREAMAEHEHRVTEQTYAYQDEAEDCKRKTEEAAAAVDLAETALRDHDAAILAVAETHGQPLYNALEACLAQVQHLGHPPQSFDRARRLLTKIQNGAFPE